MEHIFITDTFISTLSKLDFFKEELPFSSRAKGAPNLFKSQYHRASYIQFSHESKRTKRERRVVQPSSYHLHSLVGEATCLSSRTLAVR